MVVYHFIDDLGAFDWLDFEQVNSLLNRGYKDMEAEFIDVESIIQDTKDQNGRVYRYMQGQNKRIKELESKLAERAVGITSSTPNTQLFNHLVSRIGTKGVLKMLAER